MITVALSNQKGGVGKTSLCYHLAGALAGMGLSVLLVDYDPQASLTQGILGPDVAATIPPDLSAAAIAAGRGPDPRELILAAEGGFDFVPGSPAAAEHNGPDPLRATRHPDLAELVSLAARMGYDLVPRASDAPPPPPARRPSGLRDLAGFLAEARRDKARDFCLIDCPPNLQRLSAQAWAASDFLVVPVQPEDYGVQGLRPVVEWIDDVREINPGLELAGIVVNRLKTRVGLHEMYEATIRREYGRRVFSAVIHDRIGFPESVLERQTVVHYEPKSKAADEVRAVAAELVERTRGAAA